MLTSRERVQLALAHKEPDRVPCDLGASPVTGMHATVVYQLRQALKLDPPGKPIKVVEPYQMLGEIAPDLQRALCVDVVGLYGTKTMFGFKNEGWKPFSFHDGTPLLVPEKFNTQVESNGEILMYPQGDQSVPPSGRMPQDGYYFDSIKRQPPIVEEELDVADNLEEFGPISDAELAHFSTEADRLYKETDQAILASFGGTAFGDIALVPAPWLKNPRGIRDVEEWYISISSRPDYLYELFSRQCEIGLANLKKIYEAVGDRVTAVFLTGTDFGTQQAPFLSPATYCRLFQPFHKRINDWVHEQTGWYSFIHTCGAVLPLVEHFIAAGFDILNPVQCSAAKMDPKVLADRFGEDLTFWGGAVDTQGTLPFGTPQEVRHEVRERIRAFGPGGGFVFNSVHNVQPKTPVANVLAFFDALREYGNYPIR